MKIFFYITDFHNQISKFGLNYKKINLSNDVIIKFLKVYHNNIKLGLSNDDSIENFMKHLDIKTSYLLIQLENYNNVIELKNILINKYKEINIIQEDNTFIDKNTALIYLQMRLKDMVIIERIENITEKPSLFEKMLNKKVDNVYCLTYKSSRDNKMKLMAQLNKMNSSIEFVNAKDEETFKNDKLDLYKYCISDAKLKNYNNVLIMTEDNEFNYTNFHPFLSNKKLELDNYDLLFLSGKLFNGEMYKENLIKVNTIQDTSCFLVNSSLYDYIINNVNTEWSKLDIWGNKLKSENQINWNKKLFENFLTKFVCQKRNNSYFLTPLTAFKSDYIDSENRIVTYKNVMDHLTKIHDLKYSKDFDIFTITTHKNPKDVVLFQKNPIFLKFNIFQKVVEYDFYSKDSKLGLFNLYPLKTDKPHNYDKNLMKDFLNHYFLWEYFASRNENFLHFISYDNINMNKNIKYELNNVLKDIQNTTEFIILNNENYNCGYFITNVGCKKIMNYLKANSVQTDINNFMKKMSNILNTYKSNNNLITYNYKIENENLLDTMENINKKLNPNMRRLEKPKNFDNIKDDKIIDSKKFEDRISDNEYKEIIIENGIYYKNSKGLLFHFNNDILEYYGYIEDDKVKVHSLHKSLFGLNLNKKGLTKETILFYQESDKVPYYLRKLLDLISLKYNVIFMGKNFYNIKLNNVTYIKNDKKSDLILKIVKLYNIKTFYTNSFNFLMKIPKDENMTFNYIYHTFDPTINTGDKIYKNNGIELIKNTYDKFDNIYFFSENKLNELKTTLNLIETPKNFKLNSYALTKNKLNKKLGEKKDIIVTFDKHPQKVVNSFKLINKKLQNKFKLVILNNNINIQQEDVIVMPFNNHMLIKFLQDSYFFITFENNDDTYFNILNAINSYCIPIVSKYFSEFNNKFITFNNFINKHNLDDIKEIYTNEKKKIIYNNLCDLIIKKHIERMVY